MTILDEALAWHARGCSPLPLRTDGSKSPWVDDWRTFIDNPPSEAEVRALFARRATTEGLGLLCGAPSTGLEMLELEGRAVTEDILAAFVAALRDNDFGYLWERISTGYAEITPSGGMHWYYYVDGDVRGNTKIARRPATENELAAAPGERVKVLIETRGQGGFTVVAPSAGNSHPTGAAWAVLCGSRETLPVITADERDAIHAIGSLLDTMPAVESEATPHRATINLHGGTRPGDDFNARGTWAEILSGWVCVHSFGGNAYGWRRPGKNQGISATTGRNDGDNLYVFSTSTEFEHEKPYSKFAAYCLIEHHGDYSAAAQGLSKAGYGTPPPITPPPITPPAPPKEPGKAVDRHLSVVANKQPPVDGTSARILDIPDPLATAVRYGATEDGTARTLVEMHADELRYCPQRGRWLAWNGHRWCWDEAEVHREHIRAIARGLPEADGWKTYKKRALSATGVTGIARFAQSDPAIVVHIDDLDARPYELNTPGGIIDLRTGTLRPPDAAALHTRVTTVTPDFEATSETLGAFLRETFPEPRLRAYMARLLGVSVIGAVLENILPFSYGIGANGKTTIYEACMHALGTGESGYAISAPSEMLMARKHSEHPTELAQLAGARLVVCSELDDGQRFAEARVKQLTGSDSINARFMRRDPFTFKPSHTLHLLGNHKPNATTGGPAFWRRVQLVPFDHVVPEAQRDRMLGEKLAKAAPAVLAWLARGAAEYLADGLGVPDEVRSATADYAADQDTVGRFVEERCHLAAGSNLVKIATRELRTAYEQWCTEVGEVPVDTKRLSTELRDRFAVTPKQSHGVRFYAGITLMQYDTDEPDERQEWFR